MPPGPSRCRLPPESSGSFVSVRTPAGSRWRRDSMATMTPDIVRLLRRVSPRTTSQPAIRKASTTGLSPEHPYRRTARWAPERPDPGFTPQYRPVVRQPIGTLIPGVDRQTTRQAISRSMVGQSRRYERSQSLRQTRGDPQPLNAVDLSSPSVEDC